MVPMLILTAVMVLASIQRPRLLSYLHNCVRHGRDDGRRQTLGACRCRWMKPLDGRELDLLIRLRQIFSSYIIWEHVHWGIQSYSSTLEYSVDICGTGHAPSEMWAREQGCVRPSHPPQASRLTAHAPRAWW